MQDCSGEAEASPGSADHEAGEKHPAEADERASKARPFPPGPDAQMLRLVELMFFAYRDFVSDPDAILAEFGFGRAHHRVLYFVSRQPGMRVADLLDILKITKQSLARVLNELRRRGYIFQRAGDLDRRERLLYPTPAGLALTRRLVGRQLERIDRALAESGGKEAVRLKVERFLFHMVSASERERVSALLSGGEDWLDPRKAKDVLKEEGDNDDGCVPDSARSSVDAGG